MTPLRSLGLKAAVPSGHPQVRQRKQRDHVRRVLGQARECAQRGDLVQGFLHRRVAQREPVLHQAHTKHCLEWIWATLDTLLTLP